MCLLPFKETTFQQVIFLDCDTLCLGRIEGLLTVQKDFAAVLDYELMLPRNRHWVNIPYLLRSFMYFNTGVFSVKGTFLTEIFYQKLIQKIEENMISRSLGKKKLWDQDIINESLRFEDAEVLPFGYNARKNLFKRGLPTSLKDIKIIHYTGGAKPWYVPGSGFISLERKKYTRYAPLHELWHQCRQSFIDDYGLDPMSYAGINAEGIKIEQSN